MRDPGTSSGLLSRLRRAETRDAAWQEFVDRYGSLLFQWFERWGLQPCDAEDMAQETLLVILRAIQESPFEPRTTLRGWMHAVARRAWHRLVERQQRPECDPVEGYEKLLSLEARDDLIERFEELARQELFEQAQALVQQQVEPATWQAFALTCLEHRSADAAARQLGMTLNNLYVARSRVKSLLRQTIQTLDHEA